MVTHSKMVDTTFRTPNFGPRLAYTTFRFLTKIKISPDWLNRLSSNFDRGYLTIWRSILYKKVKIEKLVVTTFRTPTDDVRGLHLA